MPEAVGVRSLRAARERPCLPSARELAMMMLLNPHRISSGVRVSFSHLEFPLLPPQA